MSRLQPTKNVRKPGALPGFKTSALADELGLLPQAADQRRFHQDLPEMTDCALSLERRRLRAILLLSRSPHPWMAERLRLVQAELEARHVR
jgi:hypothetical protein